jgi:hypothetical protein
LKSHDSMLYIRLETFTGISLSGLDAIGGQQKIH